MATTRTGVILLQLGTPDSPGTGDVRRYLREFLGDPRVLTMPAPIRWLLLNLVILPFRPRRSAHAYRLIWTDEGSPLLIHTNALAQGLADELGSKTPVVVGMRYGSPSINDAVDTLVADGVDRIVAVPLFPQYASAAGGSAVAKLMDVVASRVVVPEVVTLGEFHDDPGFIGSAAEAMRPGLADAAPDHVLFSYHGLPESQLADLGGGTLHDCAADGCAEGVNERNRHCYRAQCYATTAGLASTLGLAVGEYSTTFQSRLAGSKWIEPYTDHELPALYERGVRRLAVATPSFTADCLETIEEIGIRARDQWMELGGETFELLPCVNAHPAWVTALAERLRPVLRRGDQP